MFLISVYPLRIYQFFYKPAIALDDVMKMYYEDDLREDYEVRKSEKITDYFVGFGVSLTRKVEELHVIQDQFRSRSVEDVTLTVSELTDVRKTLYGR